MRSWCSTPAASSSGAPTSSYALPVAFTPAWWKRSRSFSWSHGLPEYLKVLLPGSVSTTGSPRSLTGWSRRGAGVDGGAGDGPVP